VNTNTMLLWQKRIGVILLHMMLIALIVVMMLPLVYALFGSFKPLDELLQNGSQLFPNQWQVENYTGAWEKARFADYFLNTIIVALGVILLDVVGPSMLGYVMARKNTWPIRAITTVMAATIFLGMGTLTLYPRVRIALGLNMLNLAGIVVLSVAALAAVHTFLIRAYCLTIPKEIYEAATVDGASFFGIYWRIAFPMMSPILGTVAILAFSFAWNGFQIPFVFTLTNPGNRTLPVGLVLLKDGTGQGANEWNLMLAGTMIALIPMIVLFMVFQRAFLRNIGGGAIKG